LGEKLFKLLRKRYEKCTKKIVQFIDGGAAVK
jgi:hypothetical protein